MEDIPFMEGVVDLASKGMIPRGSYANKAYCASAVRVADGLSGPEVDLVFDAQTSGGLLLAVAPNACAKAKSMLQKGGDMAVDVGRVVRTGVQCGSLSLM